MLRFGGYDLASRLDLADWGELIPRLEADGKIHWYAFVHSYINERRIETKEALMVKSAQDRYPVWRDNGWLIATLVNRLITNGFNVILKILMSKAHFMN